MKAIQENDVSSVGSLHDTLVLPLTEILYQLQIVIIGLEVRKVLLRFVEAITGTEASISYS